MFLGTGGDTKTDEYSEKFQAWVILNPKMNIANFGHLYRALKQVFQKKIAIRYSENKGGSKAVWNFPKIHPFWYRHPSLSNAGALVVVTV